MRWILVALLALAFVPLADAQLGLWEPSLHLESLEHDLKTDETVTSAHFSVILQCPMTTPDPSTNFVVELGVWASEAGVFVTGPETQVIGSACFSLVPGMPMEHRLEWNYSIDASELNGSKTVAFEYEIYAESDGPGQFYGYPEELEGAFAIQFERPDVVQNQTLDGEPVPQAETTPGPALPLLIAGLVALARRRQA